MIALDTARGAISLPCETPPNAVVIEGNWGVKGGHAGRQEGIQRATGTHLAFFDDDDVYTPGAIQLMKDACCDVPVIFRMDDPLHGVIWRVPEVKWANVSTQMYVVPNVPEKLGSWTPYMPELKCPGGDFTFIKETVENFGGVKWREEVTSIIRPEVPRGHTVSIVTPWHNHLELADDYFAAVKGADEVLVVDNGSTPPLPFGTLQFSENLGFSKGCNVGLQSASKDVVVFLNNDIRVIDPQWLRTLLSAVEPGVLVGPLRHDNHAKVDDQSLPYIDGWCLAGMREDLLELGGFDESLEEPAYYSDNLLCLEARAHGMTLRDHRVGLQHLANVTAGSQFDPVVQAAASANRAAYEARARELLAAV